MTVHNHDDSKCNNLKIMDKRKLPSNYLKAWVLSPYYYYTQWCMKKLNHREHKQLHKYIHKTLKEHLTNPAKWTRANIGSLCLDFLKRSFFPTDLVNLSTKVMSVVRASIHSSSSSENNPIGRCSITKDSVIHLNATIKGKLFISDSISTKLN